jgi:acyl phosphate:glycerol-3-phosphate acyltransferase
VSAALWIAAAYLLGGIPTSYLAGRLGRGIDLRKTGSGSLGTTNAYRVLGWKYAVPVGLFDVAKGAVPVALFGRWANGPAWLPVGLGAAAVAGHVFSPYLGFKGGKGVATAAGMFLALAPLAIVISIGIWCGVLWLSGYVSVASIVTVGLFPVWARLTRPDAPYTFWASVVLALLIVISHQSNIRRLLAGTESRFRTRKGAAA